MSGELLRVRIVLGFSTVTVVRRRGTPSSASTSSSHSPSTTRCWRLKRAGVGLRVAPRPWFDSTGMARVYAQVRTYQEQLLLSASPKRFRTRYFQLNSNAQRNHYGGKNSAGGRVSYD